MRDANPKMPTLFQAPVAIDRLPRGDGIVTV
jgi:hypothetical protein